MVIRAQTEFPRRCTQPRVPPIVKRAASYVSVQEINSNSQARDKVYRSPEELRSTIQGPSNKQAFILRPKEIAEVFAYGEHSCVPSPKHPMVACRLVQEDVRESPIVVTPTAPLRL